VLDAVAEQYRAPIRSWALIGCGHAGQRSSVPTASEGLVPAMVPGEYVGAVMASA
jgi:hypothetical protein